HVPLYPRRRRADGRRTRDPSRDDDRASRRSPGLRAPRVHAAVGRGGDRRQARGHPGDGARPRQPWWRAWLARAAGPGRDARGSSQADPRLRGPRAARLWTANRRDAARAESSPAPGAGVSLTVDRTHARRRLRLGLLIALLGAVALEL